MVTACGTPAESPAGLPGEAPVSAPTEAPALSGTEGEEAPAASGTGEGEGVLVSAWLPTVLDSGSGPELCFMLLESYPPQCSGPRILGWNWDEHAGEFEEASGTRWGSFHLTGYFNAAAQEFTVTEAIPAASFNAVDQSPMAWPEIDFTSPCTPPDGIWRMVDPQKIDDGAFQAAMEMANNLPNLGGIWIDQSTTLWPEANPALDQMSAEQRAVLEPYADAGNLFVLNVRVVGDDAALTAAEAELRQVWGGLLCVSPAVHTLADLTDIQASLPSEGMLSAGIDVTTGTVEYQVMFDDGSLQQEMDQLYGPGVVRVISALQPVTE